MTKSIKIALQVASVTYVILSYSSSAKAFDFSFLNRYFKSVDKISDITSFPSKYADKFVRVKGKVTDSFILLSTGYFVITDGESSIAVIPSKTYPKVGEDVEIEGIAKNAYVIGDKSLTLILEREVNKKGYESKK